MNTNELRVAIREIDPEAKVWGAGVNKAYLEDVYNELIGGSSSEKSYEDYPVDHIGEQKENVEGEQNIEGEEKEPSPFDELTGKIEGAQIPDDSQKKKRTTPLFEATRQKRKYGKSSPDSMRVEGYILMLAVDTIFPASFAFLNNMLDKRIKVNAHQLSLSPEDFSKLEKLADQAADYLAINLNPIAGFFLVATFMYGNNLITLRMNLSTEK